MQQDDVIEEDNTVLSTLKATANDDIHELILRTGNVSLHHHEAIYGSSRTSFTPSSREAIEGEVASSMLHRSKRRQNHPPKNHMHVWKGAASEFACLKKASD